MLDYVVVSQLGCAWPASEVPPLSLFLDHAPLELADALLLKRESLEWTRLRYSRTWKILPKLVSASLGTL